MEGANDCWLGMRVCSEPGNESRRCKRRIGVGCAASRFVREPVPANDDYSGSRLPCCRAFATPGEGEGSRCAWPCLCLFVSTPMVFYRAICACRYAALARYAFS